MRRRNAMTLIEVIVTMFIMAIGMLALMVLFPLGAINMGQALKDDRCASTAAMAENVAAVYDIRHDANVTAQFNAGHPAVYIDPNGVIGLPGSTPPNGPAVGGVIPRVEPVFIQNAAIPLFATDRWFSLPDDISFLQSGTPDTVSSGAVDRGRRYSYAYLARRAPGSGSLVDLFVVVYSSRPVGALTNEIPLPVAGTTTNGIQVNATQIGLKRGGWILDNNGVFYRVTNYAESVGFTMIDVSPDVQGPPTQIMVMDYVAEVFEKGTGWRP